MDRREALRKATITTATSSAALLAPEQARSFLWKIKEQTALSTKMRQVIKRASSGEIDKAYTASRIIRAATENADDGYRVGATFSTIGYTTKKVRLPWEVTEDTFHENIEGEQLEADLVDQMTQQFALDLEDLDINGDTADVSVDAPFLTIDDGLLKKIAAGGSGAHRINGATINAGVLAKDHFFQARRAMPNVYRNRGGQFWLVSPNRADSWVEYLSNRATAAGDAILLGNERARAPLGTEFLEVPGLPDNRIILTNPQNFVRVVTWEVRRRRVTGETDMELAAKDKRFYVFFIKRTVIVEEMDAVVDVYGLTAP